MTKTGRHALLVDWRHPSPTSTFHAVLRGLWRICTECPYWDISYLIAVLFAVGCAIFIACGLFAWLPLFDARYNFRGDETAVGVTSFIGATLFQVGAVLLVFEAYNANRAGCFGWALHHALSLNGKPSSSPEAGGTVARGDRTKCQHHHQHIRRKREIKRRRRKSSLTGEEPEPDEDLTSPKQEWVWWPSWYDLKTHYFHEIGFMGSIVLAIGATIFYISGICSLPGIFDHMSLGLARGLYWLTYLVGGVLFIISALLYMLENQTAWWKPAPHLLGWHIGLWNLIGGVGWTLAASLGYCTSSGCDYQSQLTLIWASFAFFVGSMLLWYEALEKYPIERAGKNETL